MLIVDFYISYCRTIDTHFSRQCIVGDDRGSTSEIGILCELPHGIAIVTGGLGLQCVSIVSPDRTDIVPLSILNYFGYDKPTILC